MKKTMFAPLLFVMMLFAPSFIDAACRDSNGEIVEIDEYNDLYVSSKNLGDGSCAGCSYTCKITIGPNEP